MRVNLHKQTRGDTLVEVLIAIAVVSSVLGIAYSIMNRNIITMRDNQERSEATRQAQTQVESLKAFWDVPANRQTMKEMGDGIVEVTGSGQKIYDRTNNAAVASSTSGYCQLIAV